jgi:hypothetical protein
VASPTITFKEQGQWWLDEMRVGRIVSRKKRAPIKPATLAGYQAAVNWLNETIGSAALADIKNEVAKQLVIKMKAAEPIGGPKYLRDNATHHAEPVLLLSAQSNCGAQRQVT